MKILLLALFAIPFQSFADTLPSCEVLEKSVAEMDRKLLSSNLGNSCGSVSAASLLALDEEDVKGAIEEFKCSNLSVIQANIKSLEGEMALLQGFEKLKADIRAEKEKTGSYILPEAQKAGTNFTNGVAIAQSLELLFSEGTTPEILAALNSELSKLTPTQKIEYFPAKIKSLCDVQQNKTSIGICSNKFDPSKEAKEEIISVISTPLTAESITNARAGLAIKKADDSAYSFDQLQADLLTALPKLNTGSELSREELKAIRSLPDFKDVKIGNSDALKNANKDFKMHVLMEEFRSLSKDLEIRQQFEVQSQVGIAWKSLANVQFELPAEKRSVCDKARESFELAVECQKSFGEIAASLTEVGSAKVNLNNMNESIGSTLNYLTNIKTIQNKCLTPDMLKKAKSEGKLSAECEQLLPDIESQLSKKQNKVKGLKALETKIASENSRLMTFRNYAAEKMANMSCFKIADSKVGEFCPDEMELKVSREAMILSSDVLGTLLFVQPPVAADITSVCKEEKLLSYEQNLCDAEDKKDDDDEEEVRDPDAAAASVSSKYDDDEKIGRGNSDVKNAWRQGTINFASTLAGALFPLPTQNPYAYMNQYQNPSNFTPYFPNPNIPSISDSLIQMNSRYMGTMGSYHGAPSSQYFSSYGR